MLPGARPPPARPHPRFPARNQGSREVGIQDRATRAARTGLASEATSQETVMNSAAGTRFSAHEASLGGETRRR